MQPHHQTTLKNHINNNLTSQDKSNVKSHINAAGDDEQHSSAQTVMKWVGGIVGTGAIAGLSWKTIKSVVNAHL